MIDMKIDGLDRLHAALRAASPELRKEMKKQIYEVGDIARDKARELIHSPGSRARRGLQTFVLEAGAGIRGVVAKADEFRVFVRPGRGAAGQAAVFAQRSRRPGTTPPPKKAALAMARRYGLNPRNARALAIAIGRKGTRGHPVMKEALRLTRPTILARFADVRDRIIHQVARG